MTFYFEHFKKAFLLFRWVLHSLQEPADSFHLRNSKVSEVVFIYLNKTNVTDSFPHLNPVYLLDLWVLILGVLIFCRLSVNFYIKLTSAVFLNLKKGGGSSGASPQLTGRSLRCAFSVNYLPTYLSPLVILWSPSEVRLTSQLQIFSLWGQWVAGSWISHQSLLLHLCSIFPIFPFLSNSFHWAWILRMLFRSAPQICQLNKHLHRWLIFMSFMVSLCWCSADSIKNCSSLRSDRMSQLEQAATFLISQNLHELLRTINILKSDFSFLTCTRIIRYTLYSQFFWVPRKAGLPSKIIIKFVFIDFFLMLEYSTTFFLLLSLSSLCGFQNYNFWLDGALKKLGFLVLLVAWKSQKARVCILGFVAFFNMPASEHWKRTDLLTLKFDL